jgi:tRNA(Glu) U13 pseudouridine synthase TruD
MGRRGIENYFATEFTSRSALGFQCVARKRNNNNNNHDDFKVEWHPKTNSMNYKITLRHIPESDINRVVDATTNIQTNGFLNYYYGNEFFRPHVRQGLLPGLHLLLGQYATAFELLCSAPRVLRQSLIQQQTSAEKDLFGGASSSNESSIEELRNKKSRLAHLLIQQHHSDEDLQGQNSLAKILQTHKPIELTDALCKHTFETVFQKREGGREGDSLIAEFAAIVWNESLSRRVRQFGARSVVDGDFLLIAQSGENLISDGANNDNNQSNSFSLEEVDFSLDDDEYSSSMKIDVSQIVVPTIGRSTYFSKCENSWKDFVVQTLKQYSIAEGFEEEQNNGDEEEEELFQRNSCERIFPSLNFQQLPLWNFEGEYRKIVEYPQNFSWKLSPDFDLTEQELGIFHTKQEKQKQNKTDSKSKSLSPSESSLSLSSKKIIINGVVVPSPSTSGMLQKLELSFSLPPFVSPWMMLREMCKMERHIFDEGFRASLENRDENVKSVEAEKAAVRRRLYKRVQRKYSLIPAPGRAPPQIDSARMMASIFRTNGIHALMQDPSKMRKDVTG